MAGKDQKLIERVKYMTVELRGTATAINASLSYLKKKSHQKTWKDAACGAAGWPRAPRILQTCRG